ncbi:MAG: tetratricopeptide repeat protein [Planctomycetota bacterium]|nr:MAG: tetratricopeptide repeat protein [Planctomycetota bacterium]
MNKTTHRLLLTCMGALLLLLGATHTLAAETTEDVVTTLSGKTYKGTVAILSRATLIIRAGEKGRAVTLRIGSVAKAILCPATRNRLLDVRENDLLIMRESGKILEGQITERAERQIKIILPTSPIPVGIPVENVKMILESRTPEKAYESRRALLDIRKKDARGHLELGLWCLAYQPLEKSVFDELKQAIADKPDYTEAYLQLSDLYQEKYERDLSTSPVTEEEYNEELELYYRALHADIEHPVLYFRLGRLYRRLGLAAVAADAFQDAIDANRILQLNWMERDCELELGEIKFDSGDARGALKHFKNVAKKHPESFRAHYMIGLAWLRQGQDSDAIDALECAAEIEPLYPEVHIATAAGWFLMGVPNEIDRRIADAHGLGPPTVESWLLLSLAFIEAGQFDNATEYLEKAAALNPEDPDVEIVRGYLYECLKDIVPSLDAYERAIELMEKAGKARPEQIGFLYFQRASVAAEANLFTPAESDIEMALKLGFEPIRVFKLKGYIALKSGELDEAKRFFSYARSLKRLPELEYYLGLVALAQKEFTEADNYFKEVLKYDKSHSAAIYARGYTAHQSNNIGRAKELFQDAVRLGGKGGALAKEALDSYAETGTLSEWVQDFTEMPDGSRLTNWEITSGGPNVIGIKDCAAVIECTQKDEDRETSFGYLHSTTLRGFVLFEAEIEPPVRGEVVFGIEFSARGRYIRFARGTDGILVYNFFDEQDKPKSESWIRTNIKFGEGVHTLTIRLVDPKEGIFELLLDGTAVGLPTPIHTSVFKSMTRFTSKVFGIAKKGVAWEARTSSVRIVFRGETRKRR